MPKKKKPARKKAKPICAKSITEVRNQLLALYLLPEECLRVAPPKGAFGLSPIEITTGTAPTLSFRENGHQYTYWLKCPKGATPHWDFRFNDTEIIRLPFNHTKCSIVAEVILGLAHYFPFLPTENYLQRGGEFVA